MTPAPPPSGSAGSVIVELPLEECLRLLGTMSVGRIAVAADDEAPIVVPVSYALDGDVIVFRADRGSRLDRLSGALVSFEVDVIDPYHKVGWSVLVRGTAREATLEEEARVEVEAWVGAPDMHWIRVSPGVITGQRIQLPPLPDARGYL